MAKTIKLKVSGSDSFTVEDDLKGGKDYVVILRGTCTNVARKHTKSQGQVEERTISMEVAMIPTGGDANQIMEQLADIVQERTGGEQQPMPQV